ncbi:TraB/GumN family protein [Vibrio vulnificus]|uniref:TraB/GumN family protein n=1 Tax=Vibrio vulnificus TaxID=672 RepID=UPI001A1CF28E|nr:TraB/GumN family protein [Vibrio vulnificus]ELY5144395.1 TraB/GumN family protein [Vibrio vulnificus]MCA0781189.1 TraB/GumN family protein [Vibrio vulnificus]MCU8317412.1 TraB/GumN family protein [Vibrio vulnificus]WIL74932.1 TraB/GumN family protein [Vibrio vulnificus]HAS6044177.1 TraB/GumN family protein [Vibrio vulnificus]
MLKLVTLIIAIATLVPTVLAEPLVWKATKGKTEFRILGSIHVGSDALYPLPNEIENAIANSQALIVEADLSQLNQVTYPPQRYVSQQVLTDEQKQQLQQIANELGLPYQQLMLAPPWASALTIQMAQVQKLGYHSELGVDSYLIQKAHQHGVPLHPLESAQFQIDLLTKTPQDGKELLTSALSEFSESEQLLSCLVESWQKGDKQKLVEFANLSEISPELEKVMLTDRNHDWAQKLSQLAQEEPGHYAVVVGALHLVGKENLIALLEQSGFKTEQLTQSLPVQCHF